MSKISFLGDFGHFYSPFAKQQGEQPTRLCHRKWLIGYFDDFHLPRPLRFSISTLTILKKSPAERLGLC